MTREEQMIKEIVTRALSAGFHCEPDNGGDLDVMSLACPQNVKDICDELTGVDESKLYLCKRGEIKGFVYFVFGNSPDELICDHTDSADVRAVLGEYAA